MASHFWNTTAMALRVRQRADMVGSTFVSDAEVLEYLAVAFQEFWLRVVSQFEDLCVTMVPATVALTYSTTLADLPVDLLKIKGIRILNEAFLVPVSNVFEIEGYTQGGVRGKPTNYWAGGYGQSGDEPVRIMPLPQPDAAYTLQCYYVPNVTIGTIHNLNDTVNRLGHLAPADEYVVLKAALKCKDKEESDCSVIMAELKILWEAIEKFLTPLDESIPKRVLPHSTKYLGFGVDPYGLEDDFG